MSPPQDQMWSFGGNKKNKYLFWLALDIETKRHFAGEGFLRKDASEIVGVGRWESGVATEQKVDGNRYLLSTDNALCVTPISGLPITKFFQIVDPEP